MNNNEDRIDWQTIMPPKEAENYKFGSSGLINKLTLLFANVAFILGDLPLDLGNKKYLYTRPLVVGIASNSKAVIKLANLRFWNELSPLLRGLLERIITYYYLHFCSDEEFQNYIDYSVQKTYRQFDKSIKINDKVLTVKHSSVIDLDKNTELKKIVDKFTSKVSQNQLLDGLIHQLKEN